MMGDATTAGIAKETLQAWVGGNAPAYDEIVRVSTRRAFAVALGIVCNVDDARDLTQEAFMTAHNARAAFDAERPFWPWFHRILRNLCLNFLRAKAGRREISIDALVERPTGGESPAGRAIRRERAAAVWRAIQQLTPEHREIIVLRSFADFSYREIASTLGVSEGTVMSRLFYARKSLYRLLKDFCRDDMEGDDQP